MTFENDLNKNRLIIVFLAQINLFNEESGFGNILVFDIILITN